VSRDRCIQFYAREGRAFYAFYRWRQASRVDAVLDRAEVDPQELSQLMAVDGVGQTEGWTTLLSHAAIMRIEVARRKRPGPLELSSNQ